MLVPPRPLQASGLKHHFMDANLAATLMAPTGEAARCGRCCSPEHAAACGATCCIAMQPAPACWPTTPSCVPPARARPAEAAWKRYWNDCKHPPKKPADVAKYCSLDELKENKTQLREVGAGAAERAGQPARCGAEGAGGAGAGTGAGAGGRGLAGAGRGGAASGCRPPAVGATQLCSLRLRRPAFSPPLCSSFSTLSSTARLLWRRATSGEGGSVLHGAAPRLGKRTASCVRVAAPDAISSMGCTASAAGGPSAARLSRSPLCTTTTSCGCVGVVPGMGGSESATSCRTGGRGRGGGGRRPRCGRLAAFLPEAPHRHCCSDTAAVPLPLPQLRYLAPYFEAHGTGRDANVTSLANLGCGKSLMHVVDNVITYSPLG